MNRQQVREEHMPSERHFGEVPGAPQGTWFQNRIELSKAGVHRPHQAGISGSGNEGADSIVVSGGYEDDVDLGDVIIYTGHGGNDPRTKGQIADQTLTRQNLALARSCLDKLPVRVIRGPDPKSPHSPESGFRYDGVYRVEGFWQERGASGFMIWRFRLVRSTPVDTGGRRIAEYNAHRDSEYDESSEHPNLQNSREAQRLKVLHGNACQVCRTIVPTLAGGYSEVAHIRPIGAPHYGPDDASNLLCLCPNHRAQFTLGGFVVLDDLQLESTTDQTISGSLHTHPKHQIDPEHLLYHRSMFVAK